MKEDKEYIIPKGAYLVLAGSSASVKMLQDTPVLAGHSFPVYLAEAEPEKVTPSEDLNAEPRQE